MLKPLSHVDIANIAGNHIPRKKTTQNFAKAMTKYSETLKVWKG